MENKASDGDIATTVPDQISMSNVKPSQRLLFPDSFPEEILVMIFRLILILPRKIRLVNDADDSAVSNVFIHLNTCVVGSHTCQEDHDGRLHHFCHDIYSNRFHELHPNISVTSLLLVNQRINLIATEIFFAENRFVFLDLDDVCNICTKIGNTRANYIQNISFRYTSHKANEKIYWLVRLLPNLTHLSLNLDIQSKYIHKNKAGNLTTCKGMREMTHALSGLKGVNLRGVDYVLEDPNDPTSPKVLVNVNHRRAAGPWIREQLMRPKPKVMPAKIARNKLPSYPKNPSVCASINIQAREPQLTIF